MVKNEPTKSGFTPVRVVHLHPSRFCNLECKHCYSLSSPHIKGNLTSKLIVSTLDTLRREGYQVISLSGGEPLLYPDFELIVRSAVEHGFAVNLVSNGAPVSGHILDLIAQYIEVVAISLDGSPETHVEIRGNKNAFLYAERALERLSFMSVRYGISFCVSRKSLVDMPWAIKFAQAKGAKLIQFHPFAPVGRGIQMASELALTESDLARAYLVSKLLTGNTDAELTVQLDIVPTHYAYEVRRDYKILSYSPVEETLLSDIINPLVIDENGRLLPLSYGINPTMLIGTLGDSLDSSIITYKREGWKKLYALLDTAFSALITHRADFIDWFYHVDRTSYSQEFLKLSETISPPIVNN